MTGPSWTVEEALGVFARQGQPIEERRLRGVIRYSGLRPAGHAPPDGNPGRPRAMYDAGALQRMHALITDCVSGDT